MPSVSGWWQATKWSTTAAAGVGDRGELRLDLGADTLVARGTARRSGIGRARALANTADGGSPLAGGGAGTRRVGDRDRVDQHLGVGVGRSAYSRSLAATSQSLPRYITATRSLTFLTTARSWAMNTSDRPYWP